MKPPKNFYSNLDRRKQGLPEVPETSASDAGKVLGVGDNGAWELQTIPKVAKKVLIDFINFTQTIPNISDVVNDINNGIVIEFVNIHGNVFQLDRINADYLYVYNIHPTSSTTLNIMSMAFKLTDGTLDMSVIKNI